MQSASRRVAALGLVLFLSCGVLAAKAAPDRWTPDDALLAEDVRTVVINRDGTRAAWVVRGHATVDDESKPTTHLWSCVLPDGEPRQLTRGLDRIGTPRFSPDGAHLAFASNRKPPASGPKLAEGADRQIWALPTDGGEAFLISRFDQSVQDFDWTGNDALVAAVAESPSHWRSERKAAKDTSEVAVDAENTPPVRLFTVTVDGTAKRLTHNQHWIQGLAVAPDGRHAIVTEAHSLSYNFDQRTPPQTHRVDLGTGAMTRLFAQPTDGATLIPGSVTWTPDSAAVYVTNEHTRHPTYRMATITELYRHDVATGGTSKVALDWPRGVSRGVVPGGDGVIVLLADGVRQRPVRLEPTGDGWDRRNLKGTHELNLDGWQLAANGTTLLYRTSSATQQPQWFVARLDGDRITGERQLTKLNPHFDDKPTGRVEVVRWTGALDDEVEGLLHYPLDWKEGERRPLILQIHGGPAGTDRDSWSFGYTRPFFLWRQRGAFVLQVNYHGSAGYGLDWVESIEKRYYELEIPDIEAGVDAMIARGLADPDRLGTIGWSNGGILSAGLIVQTDRYKVASVGAADVEWISDWANVDFGAAFDNYYFGGPPWEQLEHYIEKSPFFQLGNVTTPTIIHTGTEDVNVPPHQSWSLFRALQQIGKAETKLLTYPGEPHGLRKLVHKRRKLEEDLAWFDRHLFGTHEAPNPALKKGSPLDRHLHLVKAARVGDTYGADHEDFVIPETVASVAVDGLEVGRFEITVAQLAASIGTNKPVANQPNHPATGVTFERAVAYVEWLADLTGRPFRLPTEEESRKLAKAAGSSGNTLDHWAGYSPNPEDAAHLRQAASDLSGKAPLTTAVGTFAGMGDDPVYDLDGNVAEWAIDEDGNGTAVGLSAERPADPRAQATADPAYVGLRIVMDTPAP